MAEYIEREAVVMTIRKWFWSAAGVHPKLDRDTAEELLYSIPAADVRPVVRGRWLPTKDDNKKRCSRCDVIHLIAQYPHGEANYCPNCGADMRGVDT